MKKLQWAIVVVLGLYLLYWVKSAAGVNISHRYHAIDLVKLPLRAISRTVSR
ncbi:hypothetical protein H6F67_08640 [Microcoleus sp. FACHB-1515]|uniref:hypothetical protein n=1 Tax=Cyanophyceae TaxID=3028117 RepID=UPI001687E379|nr:hypothetical protein [Microcoleus sp. FACHB-1515]MBD2089921.1 hypothetical protein [Microcoleus sp. FACHB-1515]